VESDSSESKAAEVEWSSSNTAAVTMEDGVITGVAKGTATITATSKYNSGVAVSCTVIVKERETTPKLSIDYVGETLTDQVEGTTYQYLNADNEEITLDNNKIPIGSFGDTIYVVAKGDTERDTLDSEKQEISIPNRPTAPDTVTAVKASAADKTDGKITGVTSDMEYRIADTGTWTAITGTEITGLAAGSYEVRIKATDSSFASESVAVTVGVKTKLDTPTLAIDYATETITGQKEDVTYQYSYEDDDETKIIEDDIDLSGVLGKEIQIVAKGDDVDTVDSDEQVINVPERPNAPSSDTVTAVKASGADKTDGKITGVTSAMEYRIADTDTWTAVIGIEITGLAAGSYEVRIKATEESFASEELLVKVEEEVATTELTTATTTETPTTATTTEKTTTASTTEKATTASTTEKATTASTTEKATTESTTEKATTGATTETQGATTTEIPTSEATTETQGTTTETPTSGATTETQGATTTEIPTSGETTETSEATTTETQTSGTTTEIPTQPTTGTLGTEESTPTTGTSTPTTQPGSTATPAEIGATLQVPEGVQGTFTVTNADATPEVSYTSEKNATSVIIPATITDVNGVVYKVTSVAANSFKGNTKLETVVIGENVFTIEENAFSGCKKLKKVTIGNNVMSIGKAAFKGCTSLTTVKIPASVKVVGASAFSGDTKLKTVTMGSGVTTVGDKAFYNCKKLTKITLPKNVTKIGKQAFAKCKSLKTITIKSAKLTKSRVGSKAFKGINAKATIKVPKNKLKVYKSFLKSKGIGSKVKIKKS
jgi:hypothetical protein